MSAERQRLAEEATRLWQARQAPALRPGAFRAREASVATRRAPGQLDFTLMFFSAEASEAPRPDLYATLLAAARRADELGFPALWLPERHFSPFGGPYPEPSVLAAALATQTRRIRLRAGSVVLPLHHPVAVAERWAMVDNLSNGRVDIAFGSGWNPRDFVLAPQNFADRTALLQRRVEEVRRLWRGEAVEFAGPEGQPTPVRLLPRPVQAELPVWISSTGNPESFARAGAMGANLLTMLIGTELDDLPPKIARYRAARAAAGHDAGLVTLMLHTLVHEDGAMVRDAARAPFRNYVRGALESQRMAHAAGRLLTPEQREQMTGFAAERYARGAALFGTPEDCAPLLARVVRAGVDEVACLVDFGVPESLLLEGLPHLARLAAPMGAMHQPAAAAVAADAPIAIIGMACRFPGAPDVEAYWAQIAEGRSALAPPPHGRGTALPRGGFLDDVEGFDAARFGIAPAEAAAMDPHQRLLLETTDAALQDAALDVTKLRGSETGIFAAFYSTSFAEHAAGEADGVAITGRVPSMAANRISYLFDWSGPSERVDTACSSGLVAIHRAAAALRAGECGVAVAAGVSLLLSDAESAALAKLGILSPSGACRAFDATADGQVRGEGVGALVLKPLADALRDGDPVQAVLRGSAVNHGGARSGSLTLPGVRSQAACIGQAIRAAGLAASDIAYVEAHGAGTPAGDLAEVRALEQALAGRAPGSVAVGSAKPLIGSLDAAGGIAAAIKAALMLRHGTLPPLPHPPTPPETFDGEASPLRFADATAPWQGGAVLVHGYGLGGVNADLVLEAAPAAAQRAVPPAPVTIEVTAPDAETLRALLARLRDWCAETTATLADIAATLATRPRGAWRWRSPPLADVAALHEVLREAQPEPTPAGPPPAPPVEGRRVPMPVAPPRRMHFPLFEKPAGAVATFYDFVTRAEAVGDDEVFLTLAPFEKIVPGFSWTRCFQDPAANPAHWRLLQQAQREMRAVLFAPVDFTRVRRVLDFGCGLATDLMALAAAHPHLRADGCTISAAQAAAGQARVAARGLAERVAIHHRDSAGDGFPGGPYDLILGFEVAHHIRDKDALFRNIATHLSKPAGLLLLADCVANTVAPIDLPELGAFTPDRDSYAALLARHGIAIRDWIDISIEIANFLTDPELDAMLGQEAVAARGTARAASMPLAAAVQRSWDGFGVALREGLVSYVLVTAAPDPAASAAQNRAAMEAS
ncbi:MupA/Atu3671 family FMN-dependent luciferase-like monooxygenase [Falsiroseomonas tokyonensis]|uniref:MupA/Atu3671 family FMN-dependent luciferase-like monooxygenase n=1 Tax=Falsiroseomonas tokyonensis TaxID=430521 RepID=A0ABV7BNV5_9PROT|nr:MupA/Atu3671 family FMN-dependent luciferase-like monooxygenase [Falsiroseomonas tokyonensis]MBU8536762.1 LLM class flavin-dependent oxidoreductase [Falsiroseomonas tokyonensis]